MSTRRHGAVADEHAASAAEGQNRTGDAVDPSRRPTPARNGGAQSLRVHHPGDLAPEATGPDRRVIGYVTVHDPRAAVHGDPARAIRRACELSGWHLADVVVDRDSRCRSLERPGIGYALDQIAEGKAAGLIVSELMRLVRSQVDLASFLQWFRERNAALIALDLNIDTSTTEGQRIAEVLIALGEWEQDRISRRTRSGLADAKANGQPVGRPSISDRPDLRERIVQMRAAGMTLQAIADSLNAAGIETLRGGARWRPSSVQAALGYRRPGARYARPPLGEVPAGSQPTRSTNTNRSGPS
jgi:DNA invertase Pin-like site-specific DNA recombinase